MSDRTPRFLTPEKKLLNFAGVSEKKIGLRGKPLRPDQHRNALAFEYAESIFIGPVVS